MTTVQGVYSKTLVAGRSGISSTLEKWSNWSGIPRGFVIPTHISSIAPASASSIQVVSGSISGLDFLATGVDVWEKIHTIPNSINIGPITGTISYRIYVWNTFRRKSASYSSTQVTPDQGVSVESKSAQVIYPQYDLSFDVIVSEVGSPLLSATVTWFIDLSSSCTLNLSGFRLSLWSFAPDWSQPIVFSGEWKTDVLESVNGKEQRRSLRAKVRPEIRYKILTKSVGESQLLETAVYSWQTRLYGIPIWQQSMNLKYETVIGSFTFEVDDIQYRSAISIDGLIMLWRAYNDCEAFQIKSIDGNIITVATEIKKSWPVGTRVIPMYPGRISAEQSLGNVTNWIYNEVFTFVCEPV